MRQIVPLLALGVLLCAAAPAATAAPATAGPLSAAERRAIFAAAGFKAKGADYVRCEDDVTASFTPGAIELRDLNGDGRMEALVTEGSLFCYGNIAQAFVVLKKETSGAWTKILDETGVLDVRATRHNGWLDILAGGPGFGRMPIFFYNGTKYLSGGTAAP